MNLPFETSSEVAEVAQGMLEAFPRDEFPNIVLARAGLALPAPSDAVRLLIWGIVGFSVLSLVLNAFSPSAGERRIWTPVALVMLLTSATVALTAR